MFTVLVILNINIQNELH